MAGGARRPGAFDGGRVASGRCIRWREGRVEQAQPMAERVEQEHPMAAAHALSDIGGSARVAAVRHRLTSVTGLSLVVALTALAGCGSSSSGNGVASKSPTEIIAAAKSAADDANTVHVS